MVNSTPPPAEHAHARQALRALVDGGPRAVLIAGPEGVGRRALARWFAQLLQCQASLDDPCGRCAACRSMAVTDDGVVADPDYREVEPQSIGRDGKPLRRPSLRIEQLVPRRDRSDDEALVLWLARPPMKRWRVAVIVGAEKMSDEAANAFLKTLEEPPAHARLILIATGPDALLPTVASRCTTVRLKPHVAPPEVQARLDPHPALRSGRAEAWQQALANPEGFEAQRAAVDHFLEALTGTLVEAFAGAEALLDVWEVGDDTIPGMLRERWRAAGPDAYLFGDAATQELQAAWGAYAHRELALRAWVLALRGNP